MDRASYKAIMNACRQVAGFLNTVDFLELEHCAAQLEAPARETDLIEILSDAAHRLPKGHI